MQNSVWEYIPNFPFSFFFRNARFWSHALLIRPKFGAEPAS